jgi:ankyrin repeat protein
MEIQESKIVDACKRADISQLRLWGQQGVRVSSAKLLAFAAVFCSLYVVRCLVKDLGANVEEWLEGCTPLYAAASKGHVDVVKCLVKEFGADMYQISGDNSMSSFIAAQKGHTSVCGAWQRSSVTTSTK